VTAEVTVTITCDGPSCGAMRETRRPDAFAPRERLAAIDAGWAYREGNDYCPEHARLAR